jgi:hypothetical protein
MVLFAEQLTLRQLDQATIHAHPTHSIHLQHLFSSIDVINLKIPTAAALYALASQNF